MTLNFNPRPREEGDKRGFDCGGKVDHFNPRPREEGDVAVDNADLFSELFQSTPS